MRALRLVRGPWPGRAGLDTALSRALLLRAARGEVPETLRLYRPGPVVAFGGQDVSAPGFPEALRAARARGFCAVRRLAGGRAAVFHEETLAFAWAIPDPHPAARTKERFLATAAVLAGALRRVGVDARIGEVPGEYCPGAYSVSAGGRRKLAGIGQRMVAGAAHVGGVLVVAGAGRVRDVLVPVYAALGLLWDPATAGAVEDEAAAGWDDVEEAVLAELSSRWHLEDAAIDGGTMALAASLEAEHRL